MSLVDDINDISDRVLELEEENKLLKAELQAAKAGSEKATEELANAMQLIALVAPHIERWERNYGTRLSGEMQEIVKLYKQVKEEGSWNT